VIGDATVNGTIKVYNENLTLVNSFEAHANIINRIKQLPNGYVASVSSDWKAKVWDTTVNTNWILIQTYTGHANKVWDLEYINEDMIVTGSQDQKIKIWAICSGTTIMTINPGTIVCNLKMLSNGYYLAAGLNSKNINIYNINDGSLISILKGHTGATYDFVLLDKSDELFASSSGDLTVRIWNLTTYSNKFNLTGHTSQVVGLKQITTDILASGSWDTRIKLWNFTDGTLIGTLTGHSGAIWYSIDILNDDEQTTLVSGSTDKTIKFWNINTGLVLKSINTGLKINTLIVLNRFLVLNTSCKFFNYIINNTTEM
jgi:WD40 repeat protein